MDWSSLNRLSIALVITLIIIGGLWTILGMIGFNRMGWFGFWLAGIPVALFGAILFPIVNQMMKSEN